MKKILLTGSGGFIISNFIRQAIFQKLDYSFVSIDRIRHSKTLDNIYTNKNHKFYVGDINDTHLIDIIFEVEKPDIVIHGAEESSWVDDFVPANIQATQTLLTACKNWKAERFIQLSTDKVYGSLQNEDLPWTESSIVNPIDPYSASKVAAELLVKVSGLNYNILRLCNNYGPRQEPSDLIPQIIKKIVVEEYDYQDDQHYFHRTGDGIVNLYNKGQNIRDWLYVADTCSAIALILEKGNSNDIYNISAGHEFSDTEIFDRVCTILGKGHEQVKLNDDIYRKNNYFRRASNSNKIKLLGWQPSKFKDGLAAAVQWNVNNQWHLKDDGI